MRQVAIFADAGYLHTGGAIALTGSAKPRENMELNRSAAISKLESTASDMTNGSPLLRVYWYDGVLHGQPSLEQDSLANTDNVKVRLGTVTGGRQKGVDSLIVTDLIELARNQAISDAVVLSGDEDLRVGVQIAQGFGVRIHLIGIEPSRSNQSHLLRQEADTTTEWSKEEIREILSLKCGTATSVHTFPDSAMPASQRESTGDLLEMVAGSVVSSMSQTELAEVAEALLRNPSNNPHDYDRRLLSEGREKVGRDLNQAEKSKFARFVQRTCQEWPLPRRGTHAHITQARDEQITDGEISDWLHAP